MELILLSFLAAFPLGMLAGQRRMFQRLSPFLARRHDVHVFFSPGDDGALVCDTVVRTDLLGHRGRRILRWPMFIADPAASDGAAMLRSWNYGAEILQDGAVEKVTPQAKLADSRALLLSFGPLPPSFTLSQHFSHTFTPEGREYGMHLPIPFPTRRLNVTFHFHHLAVERPSRIDEGAPAALSRRSARGWHNPSRFVHESRDIPGDSEMVFSWKWPKSLPLRTRDRPAPPIGWILADRPGGGGGAVDAPPGGSAEDHPIIRAARARGAGPRPGESGEPHPSKR